MIPVPVILASIYTEHSFHCILFLTIIIPNRSTMFSDQTEIFQHRLSLWTQQTILAREFTLYNDHKAIANLLNNPKSKVVLQIEWSSVYKAITLIWKYVKSEENVCHYSSLYPYNNSKCILAFIFRRQPTLYDWWFTRYRKSCNFVITRPHNTKSCILGNIWLSEAYACLRPPIANQVLQSFWGVIQLIRLVVYEIWKMRQFHH